MDTAVDILVAPRAAELQGFCESYGTRQFYRLSVAKALKDARSPLAEDGTEVGVQGAGVDAPPVVQVSSIGRDKVEGVEAPLRSPSTRNLGAIVTVYGAGITRVPQEVVIHHPAVYYHV